MCLIESVDKTVCMPKRAPTSEAKVDLPVPEVPANNTITFILDCMSIEAAKKSLCISGFKNSEILNAFSNTLANVETLSDKHSGSIANSSNCEFNN